MLAPLRRILIMLFLAGLLPALARAQLSGPIPSMGLASGTLSFDGHATVGDFTGSTKTVTGEMTGGDGLGAVRGWVESPVKTLNTDNKKRDKDLNKSMESDKYPTMRFELTGVTPEAAPGRHRRREAGGQAHAPWGDQGRDGAGQGVEGRRPGFGCGPTSRST